MSLGLGGHISLTVIVDKVQETLLPLRGCIKNTSKRESNLPSPLCKLMK